MSETAQPAPFRLPPLLVAVAPYLDPRTWGAVAYLWLGFPLGLVWFVGLVVGFAAGVALTIVWIGLGILAATLLGAWGAEGLERQLAIWLLGARVPERRTRPAGTESAGSWARSVVGGAALWKGIVFLALRFPLGLAGWVFSVVSLAVSLAFLAAPWIELAGGDVNLDFGPLWIAPELSPWFVWVVGLVGLVVSLHLHRALGWLWARLAEWLLGAAVPDGSAAEKAAWPAEEPAAPAPA
jgi:hypothetical protein